MNENESFNDKLKKFRKTGWIITAILGAITVGLLIAYIATDGTYGLDTNEVSSAAKAAMQSVAQRF